jgi:ribose-phosphate pyrophosphokinase
MSGGAFDRVDASALKELVVSNSIEHGDKFAQSSKVRCVSVAPLIGEAIRRIANEESVSKLFD